MLYGLAIFIFVLVCFMLIAIILLQSSKSGGMGAAMGGQAINTAFGGYGADKLLVKITSILAVSFMSLAILIGMMDNPSSRTDFSKDPTLTRNKTSLSNEILPNEEVIIDEKINIDNEIKKKSIIDE
tara:strand:+ start:235 stop:615 length:381 start_codon:yes stop_codon:yes gene_type:complete